LSTGCPCPPRYHRGGGCGQKAFDLLTSLVNWRMQTAAIDLVSGGTRPDGTAPSPEARRTYTMSICRDADLQGRPSVWQWLRKVARPRRGEQGLRLHRRGEQGNVQGIVIAETGARPSPSWQRVPDLRDDYYLAADVWHNVMLTARLCDALSSFARPGSSARSCRLIPRLAWSANSSLFRWEKTTVVAVKIKLKRLGKIREPYYRIVVADARTKRDGRAIEEIGKYHPKAEPSLIEVNSERVQHWLSVGAQPTDPVRVLLKITGDWQKFKGEPGAEGTLRVAAPRADKKEAFTAAAKESLAAKEAKDAKESKSGSAKATKSAKDSTAKAAPAKDSTAKAASAKGEAVKDGAPKDSTAKAEPAKDEAVKDSAPKDSTAKAEPAKDEAVKDEVAKDDAGADAEVVAEVSAAATESEAADAESGSGA
jgi:small subunit ribosomal protein S16